MTAPTPFLHAGFLRDLEHLGASPLVTATPLPASLARILLVTEAGQPTPIVADLIELLKARRAVLQAACDTGLVADTLRRYQKFARPGQPSLHIIQLRQQQAAARQASVLSKQSFISAAAAFARAAGIDVPPRVGLEQFITVWIDANVPKGPPREDTIPSA